MKMFGDANLDLPIIQSIGEVQQVVTYDPEELRREELLGFLLEKQTNTRTEAL